MANPYSNKSPFKPQLMPLLLAVAVVLGIFIGILTKNLQGGDRLQVLNPSSNKVNQLLNLINDQYVDTVNMADLMEMSIPLILSELDPHSVYIPAKDVTGMEDELKGSFSGVGIQFIIMNDTVRITNVIKGGPSEKVGLLAGDRIVSIDGKPFTGSVVTNEEAMRRLKGEKGSQVKVGIVRYGVEKPISFTIIRDNVPNKSVDASFMIRDGLAYLRINKFGETTFYEMWSALLDLESQGLEGLVLDLRGNGGGYLEAAYQMANEFLGANRLIVYTEGKSMRRQDYRSDGRGAYQDLPLIILTDELTASASEIVAGAIQDNDRGIIVGRRSFGKGFVQVPINFADGSMVRLTIARYYTPSGRCIQKPFVKGDKQDYEMEIINRYQKGEIFHQDSIHQQGPVYHTVMGRAVYGGGGIMPDYFVAEDTSSYTSYYSEVAAKGLIQQFCIEYSDKNRPALSRHETIDNLVGQLRKDHVIEKFIQFADSKGVVRRNLMIQRSQPLFELAIYGNIIYNIMDQNSYYEFFNRTDPVVLKAIELFEQGKAIPSADTQTQDAESDKEMKKAAYMPHPSFSNIHMAKRQTTTHDGTT